MSRNIRQPWGVLQRSPGTGARDAPCTPFSFGRGAAGFWVASAAGFVAYGYVVAGLAIRGMGEGVSGGMDEAAATALALGLAGAAALGTPLALVFGGVMRRARRGGEWPIAFATGALLTAVLYLPFKSFAEAVLSDAGYVREPALFVALAAGSMMAGAVVGTVLGRRSTPR